jgi:Xaa-Pro dipeptidase
MPKFSSSGCLLVSIVMVLSQKTLLVLQVITVEPGCYFIEPLLEEALQDPAKSEFLVKQVLEKFRRLGGVRLEDNVVVTADGCENLTKCPREIQEVEAVMAGAAWPVSKKGA